VNVLGARVTNELEHSFPQARLRFILWANETNIPVVIGGDLPAISDDKPK